MSGSQPLRGGVVLVDQGLAATQEECVRPSEVQGAAQRVLEAHAMLLHPLVAGGGTADGQSRQRLVGLAPGDPPQVAEELLFQEELEAAAKKDPRLKLHVRCSSKDGSLTIEQILADAGADVKGHHVYLCGPLPMTQAFESKFLALGVPQEHIHYEEFNFR